MFRSGAHSYRQNLNNVYVYICVCVCMYVCMYIYVYYTLVLVPGDLLRSYQEKLN